MGEAGCEVFHEFVGHGLRAVANGERRDQLRFGVEGDPRPNIALRAIGSGQLGGFLFHADEAPNLVNLDYTGVQVAEPFIHDLLAAFAHADAKAHDGVTVNAGHALDRPDAVAFAEHGDGGRFKFGGKFVAHLFVLVLDLSMTIFKIVSKQIKTQHGGARPGAGRPLGRTKVKVSVSIDTRLFKKATRHVSSPFSHLVEMLLDRHITNKLTYGGSP